MKRWVEAEYEKRRLEGGGRRSEDGHFQQIWAKISKSRQKWPFSDHNCELKSLGIDMIESAILHYSTSTF
jgi:hypothetical protein